MLSATLLFSNADELPKVCPRRWRYARDFTGRILGGEKMQICDVPTYGFAIFTTLFGMAPGRS
jgi:hypothetical protein